MEASELRIGNYVTDEFYDSFKSVFEVDSINNKGINLLIEDDGNWAELAERWIGCEYTFDKLYGIPLTEQWLIDFGFEEKRTWLGVVFENENGDWVSLNGQLYIISEDVRIDCPQYVHQLQNLYFALTGEELTIKEKV